MKKKLMKCIASVSTNVPVKERLRKVKIFLILRMRIFIFLIASKNMFVNPIESLVNFATLFYGTPIRWLACSHFLNKVVKIEVKDHFETLLSKSVRK